MSEGLQIVEVSYQDALANRDFRLDAEFFELLPPENARYEWIAIGDAPTEAQYGVSIAMNEDGVGTPIYRMNEIVDMLCIQEVAKSAKLAPADLHAFTLSDRDVLFNRTNSQEWVGRTGLFKEFSTEPRVFASYLIRLKPNPSTILPEYLVAYLNSDRGVRDVKRRARISINQSNVNAEEVKAVRLPRLSFRFQQLLKSHFDRAHDVMTKSRHFLDASEETLLTALGLRDWNAAEPLTYIRESSEVFGAGRLDAQYFAPRVTELIKHLQTGGETISAIAEPRHEQFAPQSSGEFDYVEIGDVRSDGTVMSHKVQQREAPSRATWYVRAGDVVTSTVRPIRRLTGLITFEQDGFVCSSGFVVLKPRAVPSELLLTYLRLQPVCELMDLHTSASMYPAISERDLLRLPFPVVPPEIVKEIVAHVRRAQQARERARALIRAVKRAVDIAITESESAGVGALKIGKSDDWGEYVH